MRKAKPTQFYSSVNTWYLVEYSVRYFKYLFCQSFVAIFFTRACFLFDPEYSDKYLSEFIRVLEHWLLPWNVHVLILRVKSHLMHISGQDIRMFSEAKNNHLNEMRKLMDKAEMRMNVLCKTVFCLHLQLSVWPIGWTKWWCVDVGASNVFMMWLCRVAKRKGTIWWRSIRVE